MTDPLKEVMDQRLKEQAIAEVNKKYNKVRKLTADVRQTHSGSQRHGVLCKRLQKAAHELGLAKCEASKWGADYRLFPDYIATHNN
jgi:hypothetical protein